MKTLVRMVVVLVLIVGIPASAQESLALYDSFNAPSFDQTKWRLGETFLGEGTGGEPRPFIRGEFAREVVFGWARLMIRGYGSTTIDDGAGIYRLDLNFTRPDQVTAMQGTFFVLGTGLASICPANAYLDRTQVRLRFFAHFFHTGVNPEAGVFTNNIAATIGLRRIVVEGPSPNTLEVIARVYRYIDPDGNTETLFAETLGTVNMVQLVRLSMQWDRDTDRIIFRRNFDEPRVYYYGGILNDTTPPTVPRKRIQLAVDVPHCTNPPLPMGFIDGFVDNVMVNSSAAP